MPDGTGYKLICGYANASSSGDGTLHEIPFFPFSGKPKISSFRDQENGI